jgi:uncharacterized membrane protein
LILTRYKVLITVRKLIARSGHTSGLYMDSFFRRCWMTMRKRTQWGSLLVIAVFILSACSQPLSTREKGTLAGAGLGAATGAIIGAVIGSPGAGAAIGGVTGAVVSDKMQSQEIQQTEQQRQLEQQQREIEQQRRELEDLKRQQEY